MSVWKQNTDKILEIISYSKKLVKSGFWLSCPIDDELLDAIFLFTRTNPAHWFIAHYFKDDKNNFDYDCSLVSLETATEASFKFFIDLVEPDEIIENEVACAYGFHKINSQPLQEPMSIVADEAKAGYIISPEFEKTYKVYIDFLETVKCTDKQKIVKEFLLTNAKENLRSIQKRTGYKKKYLRTLLTKKSTYRKAGSFLIKSLFQAAVLLFSLNVFAHLPFLEVTKYYFADKLLITAVCVGIYTVASLISNLIKGRVNSHLAIFVLTYFPIYLAVVFNYSALCLYNQMINGSHFDSFTAVVISIFISIIFGVIRFVDANTFSFLVFRYFKKRFPDLISDFSDEEDEEDYAQEAL